MAPVTTKGIVSIALAGNAVIAVGKIVAYALTGSSALLSEAIHSLVAVTHQTLLLFGLKHADRPADARHPFGYAKELYFWSFIAAILLFSHGAGVAIYEGIQKLKTPPFLSIAPVSYAVLVGAIVLQGVFAVFMIKDRHGAGVFAALSAPKDPARVAIAVETLAAFAGLLLALAGLIATDQFGLRYGDAIASLAIGFVMAMVAAVMSLKIKNLILGEAADPGLRTTLRSLIQAEAGGERPLSAINDIRTLHLGPEDLLVAASVAFRPGETAQSVEATTARLQHAIMDAVPEVSEVFIEVHPAGTPPRAVLPPVAVDDRPAATVPSATSRPLAASEIKPHRSPTDGNRKSRKKKRRP